MPQLSLSFVGSDGLDKCPVCGYYARAWSLYQDASISEELQLILEHEMDDAQNDFEWDEFQAFKLTLPGFIDYWSQLNEKPKWYT